MRSKDKLTAGELSAFCAQMAMILRSGIGAGEGLNIMRADAKNEAGRAILAAVCERLEAGAPLHVALSASGKFPGYLLQMAEIGEATGKLDDVMHSLSAYYEREEATSRMIRSAVAYPLIMVGMMLAVITLLVVRVMPIFGDVFQSLGTQMGGFPLAVMSLGQVLSRYSMGIVAAVAVLVLGFWLLSATKSGRQMLERARAWFPPTRSLHLKIASGRLASAMALTLASGMDVDQSLEMAHKLVATRSVREKIAHCQALIRGGAGFADAVAGAGIFSGVYASMVSVAIKTGSVDTVMQKLAARYEEEARAQLGGIIAVLEPSLVAVLSVVVGMILLSVMLPLMGIMTAIG